MNDTDRFKLLFGPYQTPKFRYGSVLTCQVRGRVTVCGLSGGPIPWPVGRGPGGRSLVVFRGLADAVRRESEQAVAHWWGISDQTVWKWRKALGVAANNEGTRRLRGEYALEPAAEAARQKALAKARDPERRAKIAAARRGRPRPPHVGAAVAEAHRGLRPSDEARRKMSAAHKARGTRPPRAGRPWPPEEDDLVRTLPAAEVVARTGRSLVAVYARRRQLGLPDGRRR